MKRAARLYLLIVSVAVLCIFFIRHFGERLPAPASPLSTESVARSSLNVTAVGDSSFFASVESSLRQNGANPLSRLFLQLLIIVSASCAVGWTFTRFGQPAVVGEMIAGILLGPSLFGLLAPNI